MGRRPGRIASPQRGRRSPLLLASVLLLGVARSAAANSISVGSFTKSTGTAPVTQTVPHGLGEAPKAIINYSTATASASQAFSLALKGVRAHVGSFTKVTGAATASQPVTGVPFRPKAVLLASAQDIARAAGVAHDRLGIGASDGSTEGCIAMQDADALATTSVDGVDKTDKAFVKVNNDTQTTDAAADLASLDPAGFTLSWTTNDAVATEMLYLALAVRRRVEITN